MERRIADPHDRIWVLWPRCFKGRLAAKRPYVDQMLQASAIAV